MAFESLWVTWKRHQHQLGYLVVGILLFAAGWQLGRTASPYYAASPIVFQEAPGARAGESTGTPEALIALQAAGSAGKNIEQQNGSSSASVAGVVTASPTAKIGESTAASSPLTPPPLPSQKEGENPTPNSEQKMFAGSKNSNLYHHKDCPSASSIKPENIIWWPSKEAAEAAGYKPSKCTQEKMGI